MKIQTITKIMKQKQELVLQFIRYNYLLYLKFSLIMPIIFL